MSAANGETFYWDFFGGHGKPKALHFIAHLKKTLADWGIEASCGMKSDESGRSSAFAKLSTDMVPGDKVEELRTTLKPNRVEPF